MKHKSSNWNQNRIDSKAHISILLIMSKETVTLSLNWNSKGRQMYAEMKEISDTAFKYIILFRWIIFSPWRCYTLSSIYCFTISWTCTTTASFQYIGVRINHTLQPKMKVKSHYEDIQFKACYGAIWLLLNS